MERTELIPLDDIKKFLPLLKKGNITTTPEGRRIYNRLYLKLGDMRVVYNLLGLSGGSKRQSSLSVSEAERIFTEAFRTGEVKQIREFITKYENVARILRSKYRYLTDALKTLCPFIYLHEGRQPVPKEKVVEKLKEIVQKEGFVLVAEGDEIIPTTHKGAPSPLIQSAAKFYFGSLLNAVQSLNLPYRLYVSPEERKEKVREIIKMLRENPPQSIYSLSKSYGMTFATKVYRILRKLGKGNYRRGLKKILSVPDEKIDKLVDTVVKGGI